LVKFQGKRLFFGNSWNFLIISGWKVVHKAGFSEKFDGLAEWTFKENYGDREMD
jgi:hypothetical protein